MEINIEVPTNAHEIVVVCTDLETGLTHYYADFGKHRLELGPEISGTTTDIDQPPTGHRCYMKYYVLDEPVSFPGKLSRWTFYSSIRSHILNRTLATEMFTTEVL